MAGDPGCKRKLPFASSTKRGSLLILPIPGHSDSFCMYEKATKGEPPSIAGLVPRTIELIIMGNAEPVLRMIIKSLPVMALSAIEQFTKRGDALSFQIAPLP